MCASRVWTTAYQSPSSRPRINIEQPHRGSLSGLPSRLYLSCLEFRFLPSLRALLLRIRLSFRIITAAMLSHDTKCIRANSFRVTQHKWHKLYYTSLYSRKWKYDRANKLFANWDVRNFTSWKFQRSTYSTKSRKLVAREGTVESGNTIEEDREIRLHVLQSFCLRDLITLSLMSLQWKVQSARCLSPLPPYKNDISFLVGSFVTSRATIELRLYVASLLRSRTMHLPRKGKKMVVIEENAVPDSLTSRGLREGSKWKNICRGSQLCEDFSICVTTKTRIIY